MTWNAELGLVLLALGLYAHDALLLLRSDEFVLVRTRRGWVPRFGAHGFKLRGREPCLAGLLAPWREQVRVAWAFEQAPGSDGPTGAGRRPEVGRPARVAVAVLLMLVFGALPWCLFAPAPPALTVAVMAAIYLTCITTLAALRRDWSHLGLPPRAFWKLCAECLACPPFCINAVRRTTLRAPASVALADVAREAHGAGRLEALHAELARRVQEQMDLEDEGSPRLVRLRAAAARLAPHEVE